MNETSYVKTYVCYVVRYAKFASIEAPGRPILAYMLHKL